MSLSKLINKLFEKFSLEDLDKEKNLILSKMPLNHQNYGRYVWQTEYEKYRSIYNPLKTKEQIELTARKRANKKLKYHFRYW